MPTNISCVIVSLVGDYIDYYLNSLKESKLNMPEFNKRVVQSVTRIINRKDISEDYIAFDKALDEREAYDKNLQQRLNDSIRKKVAESYTKGQEAIENGEPFIPPLFPINNPLISANMLSDPSEFQIPAEFTSVKYLWIPVDSHTIMTFCNYHNETSYSIQSPPMSIDALISCAFNAFCKMYADNNECARYYIHNFFDDIHEEKSSKLIKEAINNYDHIIQAYSRDARTTNSLKYASMITSYCSGDSDMTKAVIKNYDMILKCLTHSLNMYKLKGNKEKTERFEEAMNALTNLMSNNKEE